VIPTDPKNEAQAKARQDAVETMAEYVERFDSERQATGLDASVWTALNAVTGNIQHDGNVRGKDEAARNEARLYSTLFGTAKTNIDKAWKLALASC
jgi:hypothetical protein